MTHSIAADHTAVRRRELASVGAKLVTVADDGWDEARRAWNLVVEQRPAAVGLPACAVDVIAIVNFARERGLRVAPQATGHGAAPLGSLGDTVLITTRGMCRVKIDPVARQARVEAGTRWMDVTRVGGQAPARRARRVRPRRRVCWLHAWRRPQLDGATPWTCSQQPLRRGARDRRRAAAAS
jgi:hypothetical protein